MKRQTLKVFRVTNNLTQKQLANKLGGNNE